MDSGAVGILGRQFWIWGKHLSRGTCREMLLERDKFSR